MEPLNGNQANQGCSTVQVAVAAEAEAQKTPHSVLDTQCFGAPAGQAEAKGGLQLVDVKYQFLLANVLL